MVQEGELALTPIGVPASDSLQAVQDTVAPEPVYGIILTPEEAPQTGCLRNDNNLGVSFILVGLFLLFLIIALRFRNNIKYAITMFRNMVEVRTRHNVFDDTVRETSLIVLLNVLWCCSAGIVVYCVARFMHPEIITVENVSIGMLWGMALAAIYTLFMWWTYAAVGWVFSDRQHAALWVKGFSASQALMAPAFFLTALIGMCRPDTAIGVGIAAGAVFVAGKLIFIWKGFRIFFSQFSSWVLFLCYLCSLEIVPLVLSYRCAILLGDKI